MCHQVKHTLDLVRLVDDKHLEAQLFQLLLSASLQGAETFPRGLELGKGKARTRKKNQPVRNAVEARADEFGCQTAYPSNRGNQLLFNIPLTRAACSFCTHRIQVTHAQRRQSFGGQGC